MFVKATNGEIVQYPYSIGQLRRDNPNTSFPKSIPQNVLEDYGVYKIKHVPAPEYDPLTHAVRYYAAPEMHEGEWAFVPHIEALSTEQIEAIVAEKSSEVREKRDSLLAECDWIVIMHTEKGTNIPLEWEAYRQALRDITAHANFPHLDEADWPVKP